MPSMASRWNNSPTMPARLLPTELPVKAALAATAASGCRRRRQPRQVAAVPIAAPLRVQEQQRQGRQAGHHVEHQHDAEHRPVAESAATTTSNRLMIANCQ